MKIDNEYRRGIRVSSIVASIVAAATGTLVHDLPANRTAFVRKIHIYNHNAVTADVSIGAGLAGAFVASMAPFQVLAGMDLILTEEDIPNVEFTADITASSTVAAAAPANVQVQIEVEEYIGASG